MPYCRKCGAKLQEDARFCHVCGTPVAAAPAPTTRPAPPRRRTPYLIPVAVLIGVLLMVVAISALVFLPIHTVNYARTESVAAQTGVNRLILNLQADVADVNIIPQSVNGNTLFLNVSATGSTGIFGSPNPINVTFSNETTNDAVTATSRISNVGVPLSYNVHVVCDVYVDPSAELDVTAHTGVGKITLNADKQMTIQALDLQTTTGNVEATLNRNALVKGNTSAVTTTGTVTFNWEQTDAEGNVSLNLKSTTGTVNLSVARNNMLSGNVSIDAGTTTGSVNLAMAIKNEVGAQIESSKVLGGINVQQGGFSGPQELLQSTNYPAPSNFIMTLRTTTGSININAYYESSTTRS